MSYSDSGVDQFLEAWVREYMSSFPSLFNLLVSCYGDRWRDVARFRVFSRLNDLVPVIDVAYDNISKAIFSAYDKFRSFWGFDVGVLFVIYVGIGCGAGWATDYWDGHSILLGLENIAELNWHDVESLEGLILHELSHVVNAYLRGISCRELEELESNPLFLLYSEGFATRCEHLTLGYELWRMAPDDSWIEWCRSNLGLLARKYLKYVDEGRLVNDFYGSWLSVNGRSQTGYFLGHEFIRYLERNMDIRDIAVMDFKSVIDQARRFLAEISQSSGSKVYDVC